MKRICAVLLALILTCGCLAGCMPQKTTSSSGAESIGTIQEETKKRFVDLDTGEKAFNFTAEEFQNTFNDLTSKSEQKIEDWERVVEGDSVFYRYKYGENFYLGITEDSEEKFVKFLMLSYGLLDGNDAYLWGEVTSILFSVVDSTLDSAARKDLLEELEIADVDSWHIGKEGYTIKNDISYGVSIDESHNVILTIMPVPDFSSSTSVSSHPSSEASSSEATSSSQEDPVSRNAGTVSQQNAVSKAKSYLRFSPFSYEGLIGQLEYEEFSHEDAVYGADNCGADWNEQAIKKAKSYLDFSAFSYEGLIGQLEYEKFTHAQAVYGADNCGADWNEQAAKKAKSYLDHSSFSRAGLISQLEYEGFTHEQAVHGVTANGL